MTVEDLIKILETMPKEFEVQFIEISEGIIKPKPIEAVTRISDRVVISDAKTMDEFTDELTQE